MKKAVKFFTLFSSFVCSLGAASVIVVPSTKHPTISAAMAIARQGDTVRVKEGRYKEKCFVNPGVILESVVPFGAILDGGGKGTIVTLGTESFVTGFDIRNGTIGVFSSSSQAKITYCRISLNQQTGIMCVGHLPQIEDNIIVYNKGSGIQGWDVRSTSAPISHNTIAYNENNGVAIGGNSEITMENNIIAFNKNFGVKTSEGGAKVELKSNNIYQNAKFALTLPTGNHEADPMFADPKEMDFTLQKGSRCIGMGSDNQDVGARIINY